MRLEHARFRDHQAHAQHHLSEALIVRQISTWGSLIKLIFVRKLKSYRKSLIKTHDNNFAKEQILSKK